MAGGEGGAARPDNVLRGAAVLLMAQRSPSPAPSEEEDKDAADAPTVSQKKGQGKKARQERRDAADGQNGSQTEEHAEKQQDTRTESKKAVSEKKKTQNVPEEGNGGRLTFKDLQSVSNYTDKVFIGKLAKTIVHILCFVHVHGTKEGMRCAHLLLEFYCLSGSQF